MDNSTTVTFKIKSFPFNTKGRADAVNADNSENWPVIYLINNDTELYVGETTSFLKRFEQHLLSKEKQLRHFKRITFIQNGQESKSVVLDYESSLIRLFSADGKYKLTNANLGQSQSHNYYGRDTFRSNIPYIWNALHFQKYTSKEYEDVVNSNLYKFSPYTALTEEQKDTMKLVFKDFLSILKSGQRGSSVIKGSAGTGKTLVAIKILHILKNYRDYLDNESFLDSGDPEWIDLFHQLQEYEERIGRSVRIAYVVPMQSINQDLQTVISHISGLTRDLVKNTCSIAAEEAGYYDIVLVDESHRLKHRKDMGVITGQYDNICRKLGLNPMTSNQLEIVSKMSRYRIFFYDDAQSIKSADISKEEFLESISSDCVPLSLVLHTQLRCAGGNDFINYINSIFDCTCNEAEQINDDKYEFKLYLDVEHMVQDIRELDSQRGLCRNIAGYAWPWNTKGKGYKTAAEALSDGVYDLEIEGHRYIWNIRDKGWILSKDAVNQIGCVHTTQGYDLNYVGLIIGPDIDYDPIANKIIINRQSFFDSFGQHAYVSDENLRSFIINAYKTMIVRGQSGCYVYACNSSLRDYLKRFIQTV